MKYFREIALGIGVGLLTFAAFLGLNILPMVFTVALLFMFTRVLPGGKAFSGGSKFATVGGAAPAVRTVSFHDIGGQAAAKRELLEALDFVNNQDQAVKMGIRPLKGILLTGPPGTGKTLLAKAAAGYTNSVLLTAAGSEFIEMYAGVGAQRVRELFQRARETARREKKTSAVIFIDEIEVLGGKRGQHTSHLEYDQTLNQLLVELDGISANDDVRVLVIGASNRSDLMDGALLRPGRFDRIVNVDLPDREGRLAILQLHTRNKPLGEDCDLGKIAQDTFGFSGAHLESLTNEAAILAWRDGEETIRQKHLVEAIDKVILGEKTDRRPNPKERERVAIHEAGHAVVGELLQPGSVSSLTIRSRGGALGFVRNAPEDDHYLYTKELLEDQICGLLAGAVSEGLILGQRSTGASNDFAKANNLARQLVLGGMSSLGIVDDDSLPQDRLHHTVNEILAAQEQRATELIKSHRVQLEAVAKLAIEQETLSGEEFRALLHSAGPAPAPEGGDKPAEEAADAAVGGTNADEKAEATPAA